MTLMCLIVVTKPHCSAQISHNNCPLFYSLLMFLACTSNHPIKANNELRKHLPHILLSGQCHYMLISLFNAQKNTRLVHWLGHQRLKPHHPPFSRDGSQCGKAALIKCPLWKGNVPFLDLRLSNDPILSQWTRLQRENGSRCSAKFHAV